MPYPYQITASAGLFLQAPERHAHPPIFTAGKITVILRDVNNDNIEAWQSSDAGLTWAEADAANHPLVHVTDPNFQDFHVYVDPLTGYILVTYIPRGGTSTALIEFDASTGTWGTPITGGPTPDTQVGSSLAIDDAARAMSAPLGGGSFITFYTKDVVSGSTYTGVRYKVYSSGAWGSEQNLLEPGTTEATAMSYFMSGVVVGDNTRVHLLFETDGEGHGRIVYRSGSVYGYYRNDQLRRNPNTGSSAPILVTLGSVNFVAFPVVFYRENTDSKNFPAVILYEDKDAASCIVRYIDENFDMAANWVYATAAYHAASKSLHLAWIKFLSSAPNTFTVRMACTKGFDWSTPADLFQTGSGEEIETAVIGFNGDDLGMLLQNETGDTPYTTPYYHQLTPSSCSAAGCTGGSGNINAAR